MLNWIYDCEVVYVMYRYMTFEDGTGLTGKGILLRVKNELSKSV